MTSSRIAHKLTSCSLTPRSGAQLVTALACDDGVSPHEHLYQEGKLTLLRNDPDMALLLFRQCPPGYRNTPVYIHQCHLYKRLCRSGVLHRDVTEDIRTFLGSVWHADPANRAVAAYAELLHGAGYDVATLRALTLWEAEQLFARVPFAGGFRVSLQAHFAANTNVTERLALLVVGLVRECGGMQRCAQRMACPWQRVPSSATEEDETDDETDGVHTLEDDETAQ